MSKSKGGPEVVALEFVRYLAALLAAGGGRPALRSSYALDCAYLAFRDGAEGAVVQVREGKNLMEVARQHRTLLSYLDWGEGLEGRLDTLSETLAFATVSAYLIGLGDRHGENVMVDPSGRVFNVDYEYIFGRDPKFEMACRVNEEFVELLESRGMFGSFLGECVEVFLALRRSAEAVAAAATLTSEGLDGDAKERAARVGKVRKRMMPGLSKEQGEDAPCAPPPSLPFLTS